MSVCRYFIEPALRHFSLLAAQFSIFSMRKCDFLLLEILFSVAANKIPCYMEIQETLQEISRDAARNFKRRCKKFQETQLEFSIDALAIFTKCDKKISLCREKSVFLLCKSNTTRK